MTAEIYDTIIIGAGHAGCEAALASARIGGHTLLLTLNLDNVALMPCNPSIGGPAKGHLVREIDALGGEMGRNTDRTSLQVRLLNTSRGPAVQALRAQSDKHLYNEAMKDVLDNQPHLRVKQGVVEELLVETLAGQPHVHGVRTNTGTVYRASSIVLCTGTSLNGKIIVGDHTYSGGRATEFAATGISANLRQLGFELGRLKTGTPPRLDNRTIDYSLTVAQPGSERPLFFSWDAAHEFAARPVAPTPWKQQLDCHLVQTTADTHAIIRSNLHRAPMFTGVIEGVGPRYCPSIEDKIVRFADKESHQLFLEPEGWKTREVYVQGANTSLPEDVQLAMLRTIPALRHCEIVRTGYAVEYDYAPPYQIKASLETRGVQGLFFAGQINGTSGYEEAAAQGLLAGINAVRHARGLPPVILGRDQAYMGVMIDDLVTKDHREPYRMHTSRAEYRLLLRQDTADLRLTPLAYSIGLVDCQRYDAVEAHRAAIEGALARLCATMIGPSDTVREILAERGLPPLDRSVTAEELLRRPDMRYADILALLPPHVQESWLLDEASVRNVETDIAYAGYVESQRAQIARAQRMEGQSLPDSIDYQMITGLRKEARDKLTRFRPATLGQAARLAGVTPADIAVLMVTLHVRSGRHEAALAEDAVTAH